MTTAQIHLLQHTLGITAPWGTRTPWRNHFVTGPGSDDYDNCMALVESGHMIRHDGSPLSGGDPIFIATDLGKAAAMAARETQA